MDWWYIKGTVGFFFQFIFHFIYLYTSFVNIVYVEIMVKVVHEGKGRSEYSSWLWSSTPMGSNGPVASRLDLWLPLFAGLLALFPVPFFRRRRLSRLAVPAPATRAAAPSSSRQERPPQPPPLQESASACIGGDPSAPCATGPSTAHLWLPPNQVLIKLHWGHIKWTLLFYC